MGAPSALSLAARYSKVMPMGNSPEAAILPGLEPEWT